MNVFFYGLFMDETLLASKGIKPRRATIGLVKDFALRIGERATLVRSPGDRVFGVMMDISREAVTRLYAEESVADYISESVDVEFSGNGSVKATCYNLPAHKITGTNKDYAKALCQLAERLALDDSYVSEIRQLAH